VYRNSAYSVRLSGNKASLWRQKHPLLPHLDMELTERCNNNCIHCSINRPASDVAAKQKELSTGAIRKLLEEAASLGCLTVRFTGGEPLLRGDLEELYLTARKLGLKVRLFTNGTLITPRLADLLAHIPPLEKMEITVYGMSTRSYEAVTRTPGSFEAAWRGINLLLERAVPFVVKMALLPPNRDEMVEFEAWAASLPWTSKAPSFSMFFDLRCRRDSETKNRLIKELRPSPKQGLRALTRRREDYLKGMSDFCSKFVGPPGDKLFVCGAGLGGGCVDAYGYFQPCLLLRHPDTVYHLGGGSLQDAVTRFFPTVRETRASNPDYLARCARCFLKGLCEQCPAKSWMEHGTLDTPVQYLCEIAHAQARYLGLLRKEEVGWEVTDWRQRVRGLATKEATGHERRLTTAKPCSR
jgi:radical SAM protein with 4Fe4S-binding SPASM domain